MIYFAREPNAVVVVDIKEANSSKSNLSINFFKNYFLVLKLTSKAATGVVL